MANVCSRVSAHRFASRSVSQVLEIYRQANTGRLHTESHENSQTHQRNSRDVARTPDVFKATAKYDERGDKWHDLQRSPLWKGRDGSKEAIPVVRELRRSKGDPCKLKQVIKTKVSRLLKLDLLAVLKELQVLDEVDLAVKIFGVVQREHWYKPEVYLYRDMLNCLGKNRRVAQARIVIDDSKREGIRPSPSLCSELMVAYLKQGMIDEAIEVFEEVNAAGNYDRLIYMILMKELYQLGEYELWSKYRKEYAKTYKIQEYDPENFKDI